MRVHPPSVLSGLLLGLALGVGGGRILAERGGAAPEGGASPAPDPWVGSAAMQAQLAELRTLCPTLEPLQLALSCAPEPCLLWAWHPEGAVLEAIDACPEWPWDNSVSGLVLLDDGRPVWFSDLRVPGAPASAAQERAVLERQAALQAQALERLGR